MASFNFGAPLEPLSFGAEAQPSVQVNKRNDDLAHLFDLWRVDEDNGLHPLSRSDLARVAAAGAIKDKRCWAHKIQDPEIRKKWLDEVAESPSLSWTEELTDSDWEGDHWDYDRPTHEAQRSFGHSQLVDVVMALQEWAENNSSPVVLGPVPGTYIADDYVPPQLRLDLLRHVQPLEDSPLKDWHPGSDEQVLDLVHPSLFCLVYGVSRKAIRQVSYLSDELFGMAKASAVWGDKVPIPKNHGHLASNKFQWLPTEFLVGSDGTVTIDSYINNLHPARHANLYNSIAQIFQLFVPMFSNVLTDMKDSNSDSLWHSRVVRSRSTFSQTFDRPNLGPISLAGRQLQVIVKLANIHLTPEKPSYPGGAWHLEGMKNECIVATGIYYYSQDNITDSRLGFRFAVAECEVDYEQNDNRGVMNRYGLEDEGPLNQPLGYVTTLDGRCLCFPNVYQHCVQPFELADQSCPGHRKILVFFLVDPSQRILSTADIPPQRLDWHMEQLLDDLYADPTLHFHRLPAQTKELLIQHLDKDEQQADDPAPFTLARAKAYREALMQERKYCVQEQNEEMYERPFSLCEH